jgi:hypothetical protein
VSYPATLGSVLKDRGSVLKDRGSVLKGHFPTSPIVNLAKLVPGRFPGTLDNQCFHRPLSWLQFQSKLLLKAPIIEGPESG